MLIKQELVLIDLIFQIIRNRIEHHGQFLNGRARDVWGRKGSKRAQKGGAQKSRSRFDIKAMAGANPRSQQGEGQSSAEGSVTSLVDNKVISFEHILTTVTPFLINAMHSWELCNFATG